MSRTRRSTASVASALVVALAAAGCSPDAPIQPGRETDLADAARPSAAIAVLEGPRVYVLDSRLRVTQNTRTDLIRPWGELQLRLQRSPTADAAVDWALVIHNPSRAGFVAGAIYERSGEGVRPVLTLIADQSLRCESIVARGALLAADDLARRMISNPEIFEARFFAAGETLPLLAGEFGIYNPEIAPTPGARSGLGGPDTSPAACR
jgi:hypothetical protein